MSRSKGKRYEEPKLNIKKVIAVIVAFLVIIMFVIGIKEMLGGEKKNIVEKTFPVGYYSVFENGKWGVIDTKSNKIIDNTFDEMIIIPDNSKPIFICMTDVNYTNNTYKTKVLDNKNKELFTEYDNVEVIYNKDKSNNLWYETNVLKVEKDGKFGLINLEGKKILDTTFDSIKAIEGTKGAVITIKDGKQGIVDLYGNTIAENKYSSIEALTEMYENGFIVKEESNKYGVINSNGEVVVKIEFDEVEKVYGNKMYAVKSGKSLQIIDEEEHTYLKDAYDEIKQINGNNVVVKKDNKYGIVTTNGDKKIELIYDDLKFIFTDTYIAKKDNKYGIINIENKENVPFEYTYIEYKKEADFIMAQKEDNTTALIDRSFSIKTTGIVSEINNTKNYIKLRIADEYKYYNFKLEEKESKDILTTNTIFLSKKDGKYGYVNEKGIVVVDYVYDDATEQNKYGYAAVKKDGKWGAIDQKGEIIVEPTLNLENNLIVDFIGKWHLAEDLNANYYTK